MNRTVLGTLDDKIELYLSSGAKPAGCERQRAPGGKGKPVESVLENGGGGWNATGAVEVYLPLRA